MSGIQILLGIIIALVVLGVLELITHRRRLKRIPIRIHVNGTRGKSSVVRLIAAGLRAGNIRTCAKTTGALARMIFPDGREIPIYRPAGANIIEQKRIVALAASYQAQALVIECMALQPLLQSLCELRLIHATHGIITNARPDHLEVMGPGETDVARALAGTIPVGGKFFTCEEKQRAILDAAAQDRNSRSMVVPPLSSRASSPTGYAAAAEEAAILEKFRYTEHADNVALALAVCEDLGVARDVALTGMWQARPDPGAMTTSKLDFFGRDITFVNGFAANDPVSTEHIWRLAISRHGSATDRIAVFNCRADRPDRSSKLGEAFVHWPAASHVVLMGSGTYLFAQAATRAGLDETALVFAEGLSPQAVFERIISLVGACTLVMGMGNTGGGGLKLASYFENRAMLDTK